MLVEMLARRGGRDFGGSFSSERHSEDMLVAVLARRG